MIWSYPRSSKERSLFPVGRAAAMGRSRLRAAQQRGHGTPGRLSPRNPECRMWSKTCLTTQDRVYNVCMKRTHTFLPEQMLSALRRLSVETGLSVSELIRRAVDAMLGRRQ